MTDRLCPGRLLSATFVLLALLVSVRCTHGQLKGESSAYAVIDEVLAASGAQPTTFSGSLESDVMTYLRRTIDGKATLVPAALEDVVRVTMHLALKDPGTGDSPTTPSPANAITFTRYHVSYVRADGRNVPGIDVPFGFDGGMTLTISGTKASAIDLVIVRKQAKDEAPLKALAPARDTSGRAIALPGGAITISTIAQLTLFGGDQAGRPVAAQASISVNFADWDDPDSNG